MTSHIQSGHHWIPFSLTAPSTAHLIAVQIAIAQQVGRSNQCVRQRLVHRHHQRRDSSIGEGQNHHIDRGTWICQVAGVEVRHCRLALRDL